MLESLLDIRAKVVVGFGGALAAYAYRGHRVDDRGGGGGGYPYGVGCHLPQVEEPEGEKPGVTATSALLIAIDDKWH